MSDKQGAPNLPPLPGGGGNNGGSNAGAPQQTVNLQPVFTNVITSANVQQFVLASQVPGHTQVLPTSGTTNQPIGVTRIVNLSGTTPRVSVVSVAGTSSTSTTTAILTSPSRQNPKLVLTTSPKLVRTSVPNMPATSATQTSSSSTSSTSASSSVQSPPTKKSRLSTEEDAENPTSFEEDTSEVIDYRRRIMEHKLMRMRTIREKYYEDVSELFFLHNGGNLMDYNTWKKRPPTAQYLNFVKQQRLESDEDEEQLLQNTSEASTVATTAAVTTTATTLSTAVTAATATVTTATTTLTTATTTTMTTTASPKTTTSVTTSTTQSTEVTVTGGTPVAVSTTLPPAVAQLSQQGQLPGRPQGGRHGMVFAFRAAIQPSPVTAHPSPTTSIAPTLVIGGTPIVVESSKTNSLQASNPAIEKTSAANPVEKPSTPPIVPAQPIVKLVKLPASSIISSSDTIANQEQIVEKAKQEAYVMQRIAELQREGLWSERRLPKVQEPPRPKAHWDYLLEEMVWLSADFAQERKWKKSAAKKCARMVQKYFQEKAIQAQKAEKLEELRLKKIAGFIAKEIKTFWTNVEKLVEYKQQTRLEEKRKKALDQHLNFIVDQTEKYSSWLTEGLNKPEGNQSTPASIHSSRISSPITTGKHSDDDFKPNQCSDDDEETIAKAEEEIKSNHKEEVELLKKESELPLEDLLKELPPNYLEERDKSLSPLPSEDIDEENDNVKGKDTEFMVASDESSDDEDTIQKQEKLEKNVDHKQELDDLKAENEMPIEELLAKYGNASETPMDVDETDDDESDKSEDESESESENDTESEDETQDDSQAQSEDETAMGLKSLLEDLSDENKSVSESAEKQNEMDSVAALAESIQPKGNTLLTTSVVTKIPFLLKHVLREYQHIGLDWLVTMFERKLNGILADEMGLGKTIQTIALLAHLACEKGNWGPHLIIVPTSVMLNWEMECKKWCPGFKILTYYGTQKERKQKRTGWTKPNAFHICITSYKLVIQDHQSFRRKKWKYLILDEAQNIKNFKSQRWQLLLNFQTQRRLLLTGTPLQNNLMELWSLMHFLMPNVFQSHREFKEWFSNPVTGMIEGNNEYNENIIRRLHKVLRPFLLRRLKCEVEKQLPKKYEHIVMCRLSKRQRYLYDDFMSRAKTKETLASGNLLSVINVLMQLRKVCNHPNLFEVRPTVSPFQMEGIDFHTASLAWSALDYDPFKHIELSCLNLHLVDLEFVITAFVAHRMRRLKAPRRLIEEIDSQPEGPPRCPSGKIKINVRLSNQVSKATTATQQSPQQIKIKSFPGILPTPRVGTSPMAKNVNSQSPTGQGVTLKVAGGQQLQGFSVQLVPHQGGVKAIPVGTVAQNIQSTATVTPTTTGINAQRITIGNSNIKDGAQRLTTHTYTVKHGDSVQKYQVPSFAQLVQTSTGRHIILTNPNQQTTNALSFPVMTSSGQRLTVLSKQIMGLSTTPVSVNKVIGGVVTTTAGGVSTRPVMRVPPLNVSTAQTAGQIQPQTQIRCGIAARNIQKDMEKNQPKESPKSEFYLAELEDIRRQRRQAKLTTLADINERRCAACPLYGEDLFTALRLEKPATACQWHNGWIHCASKNEIMRSRRQFFSRTEALAAAIKSTEQIVEEFEEIFSKFVVYVPAVRAFSPRFHVSHPPPHKLWKEQHMQIELQQYLSPKLALFHPIDNGMLTQFPDPRLIQYDCGKLQSLDLLLRKLKMNDHRVLIFTQMTRMLDVLEAFLNYHGYIYLRLDGATKVDQRQVLMERFNNDKRIFCFILSTRSGGIGVNLTGADTVVFYDSDWNPTMDAQAQDRCHRIGQTRDVHIYRLISERTIEENILRKANEKRLLGDIAIEGGNFTTAYFKSSTIQDLFNVDQSETDASARMAGILDQNKERERNLQRELSQAEDKMAIGALESALAAVEEDQDVQAAKTAKAEAVADLAEFDENIPVDDGDNEDGQISKAELEVRNIVSQLTPVERYAMRLVEETDGNFSAAQLAAAERELEEQKKEWELDRLRAMREEEERQMRMTDDDENPLTFTREDSKNQVNNASSNLRRVVNRRPARLINRRGRGRRVSVLSRERRGNRKTNNVREEDEEEETTSDSESETTSMSDTDSQNDDVDVEQDDSSDEDERKSSRVDSDDENYESKDKYKMDKDEDDEPDDYKNNLVDRTKNHFDLNSPRTRSRGNVKINLWTLDVSPILPEGKPRNRSKKLKSNIDKDGKLDSSDFQTANDISLNSSTEDSLCDEDDVEMKDIKISNVLDVKVTKSVSTRTAAKYNLKSCKKETDDSKDIVDDKTNAPKNQEIQSNDHHETISTSIRPGRPRKHAQSATANTTTLESNLNTSYLTRSSNKVQPICLPQEKKMTALKINCKEELEICDINDTKNEQCEINRENDGNIPLDIVARPNNAILNIEIHKEKRCGRYDKSDDIEQQKQLELNITKCDVVITKLETADDHSPSSPTLGTRKIKLTRSYARTFTGSKDNDIHEEKNLSSTANEDSSKSSIAIDVSQPAKNADDGLTSTKSFNPSRCSPILITGSSKVTRLSAKSSIDTKPKLNVAEKNELVKELAECKDQNKTKEKNFLSERELDTKKHIASKVEEEENHKQVTTETKEKHKTLSVVVCKEESENLDKDIKDEKIIEASTTSNYECTPPSLDKLKKYSKSAEEGKEHIILKITRSSVRFTNDSKSGEHSNLPNKESCEKISSTSSEILNVDDTISESALESGKANLIKKKNNDNEKQPQFPVEVTRSFVRTGNESLSLNKELPHVENSNEQERKASVEKEVVKDKQLVTATTMKIKSTAEIQKYNNDEDDTSKEQDIMQSVSSMVVNDSPPVTSELKLEKIMGVDILVTTSVLESRLTDSEVHSTETKAESNSSVSAAVLLQSDKLSSEVDTTNLEQTRVTRSNIQQSNSLPRYFQSPVKTTLRRRPDTPMPVLTSPRPVTRSSSNNSTGSSDESGTSSAQNQQRLSPRTSKPPIVDNGFLVPTAPVNYRRSRSTTYIKMSDRIRTENRGIAAPVMTVKTRDGSTVIRALTKKRPDTPMPSAEQVSRAGKMNDQYYTSQPITSSKISPPGSSQVSLKTPPPSTKVVPSTSTQATSTVQHTQPISESLAVLDTDSSTICDPSTEEQQSSSPEVKIGTDPNGNSVNSDFVLPIYEKPQRTAKVVAILTLDSKNNGKNNQHQMNSSTSPQKTKPLISESDIINNARSLRLSKSAPGSKIAPTILTTLTAKADDNSSSDPAVVAMVDLDDEPECTGAFDTTPRASKRIKRTRLANQLAKSNLGFQQSSGKDIQTIEIEDDEEDKVQLKKLSRYNPPPLIVSGSNVNINDSMS